MILTVHMLTSLLYAGSVQDIAILFLWSFTGTTCVRSALARLHPDDFAVYPWTSHKRT